MAEVAVEAHFVELHAHDGEADARGRLVRVHVGRVHHRVEGEHAGEGGRVVEELAVEEGGGEAHGSSLVVTMEPTPQPRKRRIR
ncbi:MAG: hypothetical protein U1F43_01260 [Myxococcota bacterium]